MTTPFLMQDLEKEEGRETRAYPDPLSPLGRACTLAGVPLKSYRSLPNFATMSGKPWTIGVGCTGDDIGPATVWDDTKVDDELSKRLAAIKADLDVRQPWWSALSDARQDVIVMMAFQMGVDGFEKFPHAIAAMQAGDFDAASEEMLDSLWARQTPMRASRMAHQMQTGVRAWANS